MRRLAAGTRSGAFAPDLRINRLAWPVEAVGQRLLAYWAWFETPDAGWGVAVSGGIFAAFAAISALCTVIAPPGAD